MRDSENENKKTDPSKEEKPEEEEKSSEKSELVPVRKVIYCEIDDEVTAIYDKLRPVKTKDIYIVIPKRAVIFQSIVNLKILKRKAEKDNKTIYFITNDSNGIYLAQQVGITVYDKTNSEGKPSLFSAENESEEMRITPLKAAVNDTFEQAPTRMAEKKISISELLKLRRGKKNVTISRVTPSKEQKEKKEKSKFVLVAPNRHALISLIVVSIVILLVVVYIALPGVTVYLTPSASVLEQSVNITLADYQKNRAELEIHPKHTVASYPIFTTVEKTITYSTTGKKFSERGANSSGKITIFNTTSNAWPLIAKTRFQTQEGIVFRIASAVTVPAASSSGLGQLEVFVVADPVDAFGAVVGERGNIAPSKFFLPGLKESSRSEIYAESKENMTGGITDFISYVSAEDIEGAKVRMNDELMKSALAELEKAVVQKTELTGTTKTTYSLLKGDGAIKTGEIKIELPENLEGRETMEFTVKGSISVSGVYFEHDSMVDILKSELILKKSPQKELLRINEDSTSYRIYEWDDAKGKIKLTVNIKGIEQFEINPEKESGAKLLQKIKDHIAGKDIEEAKAYIQNLPEINKVEIESWPVWSPTVPSLSDNIEFEVREALLVE